MDPGQGVTAGDNPLERDMTVYLCAVNFVFVCLGWEYGVVLLPSLCLSF